MTTDSKQLLSAQRIRPLWDALDETQRQLLAESLDVRKYRKDEPIYYVGDTPTHVMYLLDGKAKVCKDGVGSRQQIVRILKPGTLFGYRAAFACEDYKTYTTTLDDSVVGFIPAPLIKQFILENNRVAVLFIQELSYALGFADLVTVNLTQKHIRGRLADALLRLKQNYGTEADQATLRVQLSREDLGNMSNMTTSNAIRTLSAFASERLVELHGKKIKLLQEAELQKISRLG